MASKLGTHVDDGVARARGEIEIEKDKLSLIAKGVSSYYIQKYPEKVNLTISEVKDLTSGWETELHNFIIEFEEDGRQFREESAQRQSHHRRSAFILPLLVYLISVIGPAVVIGISIAIGWSKSYLLSHLYVVGTLGQGLMDLPAVVMFARTHVDGKWRGRTRDHVISIGAGLACAAVLAGTKIALSGQLVFMEDVPAFTQSLTLAWPWNVISATLAVLAYGPGEAIFVVYLVAAFDTAIGNQHPLFSQSVVITALLWGLPHIANIFFFGWGALANALFMVVVGLAMGLLFKGTRSSLGPVVFWTLVNGTSA